MTRRFALAGAFAACGAIAIGVAWIASLVGSETPIGPLVRIFDSLAVMLLGAGILCALGAAWLGLRVIGGVLVVAGLGLFGLGMSEHMRLSLPAEPDRVPDLRVLFYNAYGDNAAHGYRIAEAAIAERPDVMIFAEGEALYPALPRLARDYTILSPCEFDTCELLVAVRRKPDRFWMLSLNAVWMDRYAVTRITTQSGKSAWVVGNHLLKPFLSGLAEPEWRRLATQYDWLSGPVVAVGDYNATPWSLPMRDLLQRTGFRTMRWPIATWPSVAGRFGLPIDHVLVHNGARVVTVRPFGRALGSNHLGLIADIALP